LGSALAHTTRRRSGHAPTKSCSLSSISPTWHHPSNASSAPTSATTKTKGFMEEAHGGCPAREPTEDWEMNACLNEQKDNVDACHCTSTDQSLEEKDPQNLQDPVAHGACYWRGPAFYRGQGKGKFADQRDAEDEISSFTEMNLKIDHSKVEAGFGSDQNLYGRFFWNEIVLDNTILERLMPNAVMAIALGVGGSHAGQADDATLQVARDLARNIGDNVKVIGFDDSNTEARFSEL